MIESKTNQKKQRKYTSSLKIVKENGAMSTDLRIDERITVHRPSPSQNRNTCPLDDRLPGFLSLRGQTPTQGQTREGRCWENQNMITGVLNLSPHLEGHPGLYVEHFLEAFYSGSGLRLAIYSERLFKTSEVVLCSSMALSRAEAVLMGRLFNLNFGSCSPFLRLEIWMETKYKIKIWMFKKLVTSKKITKNCTGGSGGNGEGAGIFPSLTQSVLASELSKNANKKWGWARKPREQRIAQNQCCIKII